MAQGLQGLTIQDSSQLPTKDTDSDKEDDINLDPNDTDELEYVAFSHVWGDWEWRKVPGIPYEVKVSQEKAEFIANDLPGLVGDGVFWMDTLTVDQGNEKEVLAIVDAIPAIFKMAKRTIVVRESDGFYDCCVEAVDGFKDLKDFSAKSLTHYTNEHYSDLCVESYLQRLWTLQECLLSHTIQFFIGSSNKPTKQRPEKGMDKSYASQVDGTVIVDSLWVLAFCLKGIGVNGVAGITEFLRAYVYGGTIVNQNQVFKEREDLHSGAFMAVNLASRRSATMPRDYIFATMPQFPWYRYPRKKALEMTFGEIYMDLYQQSATAGHPFTCRFTRSMMDPTANDPVSGWLPSEHQPSPRCLGDFLKLMGHRVPGISNGDLPHVHVTTIVTTMEFCCDPTASSVLSVLEDSMSLFQQQWQESHRGGEVSKFGNFPEVEWILDHIDDKGCGWMAKDLRHVLRMLGRASEPIATYGSDLDYGEDNLPPPLCSLEELDTEETETKEDGKYVSIFQYTNQVLDHMWCAHDPMQINRGQRDDWRAFKRDMRDRWSPPLLRTMLLLAAMIVCRLPLSAASWVNRLFVPIYVRRSQSVASLN
ncbi:hypothetical protein NEMBOFW57_008223, partial [Staphylotrichum longicolle]